MKKELYIFRHGETDWNKEGRSASWSNIPLNQTGILQAENLSKVLKNIDLEIIYSSPILRALETAKIVAKNCNIKIITNDALKERNNGILVGSIIKKDFPYIYKKIGENRDYTPPKGESLNQLKHRVINFIENIVQTSDKNIIGICTHNGVAMEILETYSDVKTIGFYIPNTSYYKLIWNGKSFKVNDHPELKAK
ncbi:MAG: histidine phosphatase family protein [Rickettsiales bacterium]|jgi:broad specificity phosphatase PhoE|nr:histidine phosphatase family protein [Rickettsiales bacterium]